MLKITDKSYIDPRPHKVFKPEGYVCIITETIANELRHEIQQLRRTAKVRIEQKIKLTLATNSLYICDALYYSPSDNSNGFQPIIPRCLIDSVELIKDWGRDYTKFIEWKYSNTPLRKEYYEMEIVPC